MKLLYIVRRYGPVGGMERYVWELSRELSAMGHQMTILCEGLETAPAPANIHIVQLGAVRPKPRWLAHLRFSRKVSDWLAAHPDSERIIHSHERTAVHHVTTFHGPPFAAVRDKPLWKRISPRIYANLWLEKRELYGPQVKAVVPNSALIARALLHYYPKLSATLVAPVVPGVCLNIPARADRPVPRQGGVIGFIGKEWKRKGLDIAVAIVQKLREQRSELRFVVVGPEPKQIRHLFKEWHGGYQLLGETDSTPLYSSFDLLLHPARQEPYGMVIAEARAAGLPVIISSNCGIANELQKSNVLNIDADLNHWVEACQNLLGQKTAPVGHSWHHVAEQQLTCYRSVFNNLETKEPAVSPSTR
ncbi:MAG: glycosyltransferase family 4 protein [Mariprofundus sp.]|nr:glycosyltransferase family 4 protein [Mariprofundus sp.]